MIPADTLAHVRDVHRRVDAFLADLRAYLARLERVLARQRERAFPPAFSRN